MLNVWFVQLFPVGVSGSSAVEDIDLDLVGVVCYYMHHYSTFFFHPKRKLWISFDDACVSEVIVSDVLKFISLQLTNDV